MSEFPCSTPISVSITIASGECEVIAEERDTALVDVSPYRNDKRSVETAEATKVDFRDDRLSIQGPEGMAGWFFGKNSGSIRVTVRVPRGSSVNTKVASAQVQLRGELDTVSVTTASGGVSIEQAREASVNTASGDIHVMNCTGDARGNTASGDLQIDNVANDVSLKSVSGDVRVGSVGGSAQIGSVSGDVTVNRARTGSHRIKTVSGSASVGVAAGTGVWLDLNSVSGTTASDLAVGDMPTETTANMELRVNTVSGNIDIFRAGGA
ncbi:DUF4097 family beta strand repeat-containing protein [Stackebrandtia soli]|uniref:DUF4097 family beta strand repeat-containing protein n=1 Tax=Stackebrandtia soli TaxID=1892856 RepID=UPI0039E9E173